VLVLHILDSFIVAAAAAAMAQQLAELVAEEQGLLGKEATEPQIEVAEVEVLE
jgi:hypothetical protein